MSKKLNTIALLTLIVTLGLLLRFWRLDIAPKGALIDELHFGYLAQSLITTGKDEHGVSWPIIFEGFGDQKLPAMTYLDIPSVALFGLNLFAIRVPSALAGTILILATYWLVYEVTKRKKWALFAALVTAVSPWSFFLSRFGFESNLALLFLTVGLASLFTAERTHKNLYYVLSAIGLGLTWYSYVAYRPITLVLLAVFCGLKLLNNFQDNKKTILIFLLAFALSVVPLFSPSSIGVNSTRYNQVGISTDPGIAATINEKRTFCAMNFPAVVCYAAFNKPVFIFKELTHRYLLAYSPEFLVTKGELSTNFLTIDSFGQFFPPLYPLLILGVVGLLFSKKTTLTKTQKWLIIVGLIIAPIPTALVGEPQKVRLSALYPFLLLLIVNGMVVVDEYLNRKVLKHLFYISMTAILLGYTFLYQMEYHGVHMVQNEVSYQSYLPGLHQYLDSLNDEIIVNIVPFHSDPLMFHAFYTQMHPATYQSLAVVDVPDGAGFSHTVELGNITAYKHSPEDTSCFGLKKGVQTLHVTDKKFEYIPILHTENASNGVHTYAYVYDVTKLMNEEKCAQRKAL